jgi:hypothetical protein
MNLLKKYKTLSLGKQLIIVTVTFFVLLGLTTFLPYKEYFDEMGEVTKSEKGYQSFEFTYLLTFSIITAIALMTLNKLIVSIVNSIILVFLILGLLLNTIFSNMYATYGPISPETKFGYFLSLTLVLIYMLRTFLWRKKLLEININRKITYIPKLVILFIPLYFIFQLNKSYNEPIMRSKSYDETADKFIRSESWDYTQGYNAYITKHFSGQKLKREDTKYKNSSKYVLDSVDVMIFDENSNIEKDFSKKIKNNHFDINEILND